MCEIKLPNSNINDHCELETSILDSVKYETKNKIIQKSTGLIWVHVSLSLLYGTEKGYMMVNDEIAQHDSTINSLAICSSGSMIMGVLDALDDLQKTEISIRDLREWNIYKAPGEIKGLRHSRFVPGTPNLYAYYPLDESSGITIYNIAQQDYIFLTVEDNWINYDTNKYGKVLFDENVNSNSLYKSLALGFQSEIDSPIISQFTNSHDEKNLFEEFTFIIWVMIESNSKFKLTLGILDSPSIKCLSMNVDATDQSKLSFDLYLPSNPDPKKSIYKPRSSSELVANKWTAIGFVKSKGSYKTKAAPYGQIYMNAVSLTTDSSTACSNSDCPSCSTGLLIENMLPDSKKGATTLIKNIKMFSTILNPTEILVEMHRKGNPWKYMMYLRYSFDMDGYPNYKFNDYATKYHSSGIVLNPNEITVNHSYAHWLSSSPSSLCESYEYYDVRQGKCAPHNRALMFVRDSTHNITITTEEVGKNFTVEFWIKLVKTESSVQEIMRTNYFTIYFENSGYAFNMFNSSLPEISGYKSISKSVSPVGVWTHIAVANCEFLNKSAIYVNGIEEGSNYFIMIEDSIKKWTIGNETDGFTGLFRDLRLWKNFRSAGRTHANMHVWQWDTDGFAFNLVGYYMMDEGSGTALRDHSSYKYTNVQNFRNSLSKLNTPFWARCDDLPVMCYYNHIYDFKTNTCLFQKKVMDTDTINIKLEVNTKQPYRDWSFNAWVKNSANIEVNYMKENGSSENFFTLKSTITKTGTETGTETRTLKLDVVKPAVPSTESSSVTYSSDFNPNHWYQISFGYFYAEKKLVLELAEALTHTREYIISKPDDYITHYGDFSITLMKGRFMHVSLWKKFMPIYSYNYGTDGTSSSSEYINPYFSQLIN